MTDATMNGHIDEKGGDNQHQQPKKRRRVPEACRVCRRRYHMLLITRKAANSVKLERLR